MPVSPGLSPETYEVTRLKQLIKRQDAMIEKLQKAAAGAATGANVNTSTDPLLAHPIHKDIMGRAIAPEDLVVYYDYKCLAIGRISKITPRRVRVARCDKAGLLVRTAIPFGSKAHSLKHPDEIYVIQQRNKP